MAWEADGRPSGWQLVGIAKECGLTPLPSRSVAETWIEPWKNPAIPPSVPKDFDKFFVFVQALGAEEDLDREPDLLAEGSPRERWRKVHQDARQEAGAAKQADQARRTTREARSKPKRSRRVRLWWSGAGLTTAVGIVITILVLGTGGEVLPDAATSSCAYVIDGPAGVYPSPDTRTAPIKFKRKRDRVNLLDDSPRSAEWARVFTPRDQPGFHWMLTRQLGPRRPC
ncbi:hypothetical protein ACFY19_04010 [Streptosporangium saharense]|uniref:hypothetical protein n=1 Tax=Streptosporangium saharense TaxID=1706840 RepID=UPI00368DDD07